MQLPDVVSYGLIQFQGIAGVEDTTDADDLPDAVPARGTVTLRASAPFLKPTAGLGRPTIFPRPRTFTLDGEGHMVDVQGRRLISLEATDSPGISPQNFTWTATFNLLDGVTFPAVSFLLPAGSVVNLSDEAVQVNPSTGTPITAGRGVANASIDPSGNLLLLMTDGTTINAGPVTTGTVPSLIDATVPQESGPVRIWAADDVFPTAGVREGDLFPYLGTN